MNIPCNDISDRICIKGKQYNVRNVPGDGNCLFHCFSLAIHGSQSYVSMLRGLIARAVAHRWNNFKYMAEQCHGKQFLSANDYLFHMFVDNAWGTACEIKVAALVLKMNITTFLQGSRFNEQRNTNERTYLEVGYSSENSSNTHVFLLLADGHFQLLEANNPDETSFPSICREHDIAETGMYTAKQNNYSSEPQYLSNQNSDKFSCVQKKIVGSSDLKNNVQESNACLNVGSKSVYLPEEADIYLKCRKLCVEFQPSHEGESKKEKQLRMKRNRSNISYKENKLNINVSSLPNPPPLSDNKQYNKAMDTIRSFELEQMFYSFKCCASCKERRLNLQVTKENICRRCNSDKNIVKLFSNENYMDPGEVPAELIGLSVVEQQLICRIAPAIHVHLLKHGGIASSGHCVSFSQDVNEPAQILPKLPHEINVLKVRRQGKNDSVKEFRVRRYTIQSALQWLKSNNPAYSDIIINEERLNKLPVNDGLDFNNINVNPYETSHDEGPAPEQLNSDEVSGESDSCVLLPEPSINIRDEVEKVVEEVVGPEHGSVTYNRKVLTIPWPTRDGVPVSEFTTRNFFTLAYPCLFPTGLGDFYMNRPRTCSAMADWADHLIWYSDGRFANHPYFKFIVHNMIMRKRTLEQSTYIVQQQLGDKHLTVSDIKEKLQKGDRSIAEKNCLLWCMLAWYGSVLGTEVKRT